MQTNQSKLRKKIHIQNIEVAMPQTVRLSYLFDVTKVEKRNFIQVDGQFDYGRNFKASIIRSNLSGTQFIYFTEYDRWV